MVVVGYTSSLKVHLVNKSINIRVSIFSDGREQVFLLLGGAGERAVRHYFRQALHRDGRGAVG